jgi:hypothetical protein
MADKKNIVIKVKYPSAGKVAKEASLTAQLSTEWNFRRIAAAVFALGLIITGAVWLSDQDTAPSEMTLSNEAPKLLAINPVAPATPAAKEAVNLVARAQLTTKVTDNEPADNLEVPLKIDKKGQTSIYFFVELKAMKGKTVYHEWLLNDTLISRKKVKVSADAWRTASRQVFQYTSETNWTARLVDETGKVITEKRFDVVYQ